MEKVNSNSYWLQGKTVQYDMLKQNRNADVCIIGGGITGITLAYYLTKNGKKVILLERDGIGSKTTGNTTGKITSGHGLFYKYLEDSNGLEYAKLYYDANEEAIREIKNIIDTENIDCDFSYQDNYIYATNDEEKAKVEAEVEAINRLGGKAYLVESSSLPIKFKSAVKIENQAMFNSIKYIQALSRIIVNNGGEIYENSKVMDIRKDDKYKVYTSYAEVKCDNLVLTTNYPIKNFPGMYFTKMYQSTSYAVLIETKDSRFDGMYISSSEPILSFRNVEKGEKDKVLIVGCDHRTGDEVNNEDKYSMLENVIKGIYKDAKVLYKWQTEDCITLDKIPYIGEFSSLWKNAYVATGFKKWGMTMSNVAANIIADKILNRENKYDELFRATRVDVIKNRQEVKNMLEETGKMLVLDKFKNVEEGIDSIKVGEGKIVRVDGKKVGVYKESKDKLHFVSPYCSHLGCDLTWNSTAKTWDCPCHGSRYDYTGKSLYAPSVKDIEK